MKKYIIGLFAVLLVTVSSCNKYSYPRDKEISTKEGVLSDTVKGFIPSELTFGGTLHAIRWDEGRLNEINNHFLTTKEVVLYNYYLDRDVYRLLLSEKGESPIIITVNKQNKDAWLVSKRIHLLENNADSAGTTKLEAGHINPDQPLALQANFDNYTKTWNRAHIQKFDSLFQAVDFFNLPIGETEKAFDSFYLMEVHQKDKYWFVYRPMEDPALAALIEYMRGFSRF